ncbi:hypothetical protein A9P82_13805 [Arachidicoccus ginsenosidimutans]|uniref:hypothetical protein n=1 Tax=Arachidicoccus sp. BS20 TaxID=1850526 RepID=UPI0007F05CAB|nr:hypothetical protein [Arachidicoccus sp. BS20]ANI90272.1 hypothetical protein A9P82_13805 [Arachidicoccus sp. BS20]
MRKLFYSLLLLFISLMGTHSLSAQYLFNSDSAFNAGTPMTGHLWGYTFGDYYYKAHADALDRGNANQYTGIPKNRNAFQIRRIYIGYDFNINKKFSTELLLAAEDNFPAGQGSPSSAQSGDELSNGKLSFYIKLADLRIKNIWRGTDLVIGQQATPAFPGLTEKIWNYRNIERTIADIRRTPSYDLGVGLQGTFDPKTKNYGYDLLMADGTSAKPENDGNKWFYGDLWAKFFNQKLVADIYGDYERLNWTPTWHHSRQMFKGYIAYNTAPLTIGVEGFINNLKQDAYAYYTEAPTSGSPYEVLDNKAKGISAYIHGDIVKNKLRFFARYDHYTPTNVVNNSLYSKYVFNTGNYNDNSFNGTTATGDETYTQNFITAGLDFSPAKNVHIEPNVWYNHYKTQLGSTQNTALNGSLADKANGDYDLAYRITFYYTFGK